MHAEVVRERAWGGGRIHGDVVWEERKERTHYRKN